MNAVMQFLARIAAANRLTASSGPLNGCQLVLFTNPIAYDPNTTLADLTLATFSGYAAVTGITFGTAYIGVDGFVHVTAPSQQFSASASPNAETIYGWALLNTAGTTLILGTTFDTPINITQQYDGVLVQPDYAYAL